MTREKSSDGRRSEDATREVLVWDLPVRVFHWTLVVLVVVSWLSGDEKPGGFWFALHTYSGYGILLLILFRVIWGFVGSETARFASFVTGWGAVSRQLRRTIRFRGEKTTGHTPAGGWMIVALLTVLVVIVVTGLLAAAKEPGGLLNWAVPAFLAQGASGIHHLLGENLILLLVIIHVLGVIVESLLSRRNLVRAMVTGYKRTADPEARDARGGSLLVAIFLGVLLVMFGVWMVSNTQF